MVPRVAAQGALTKKPVILQALKVTLFPLTFPSGPTTIRIILCSQQWDPEICFIWLLSFKLWIPRLNGASLLKLKSYFKQKNPKHFPPPELSLF